MRVDSVACRSIINKISRFLVRQDYNIFSVHVTPDFNRSRRMSRLPQIRSLPGCLRDKNSWKRSAVPFRAISKEPVRELRVAAHC